MIVPMKTTSSPPPPAKATLQQMLPVLGIEGIPRFGELVAEPDVMHRWHSFAQVRGEDQSAQVGQLPVVALHHLAAEEHGGLLGVGGVAQVVHHRELLVQRGDRN